MANEAPPFKPGRGRKRSTSRGGASQSILPGEPGQTKPRRGGTKPKMPLPTEPMPENKYQAMKKAVRTKGMQPGEKEQLQRIAEHRGVGMKEARAIAIKRTAKGKSLKGLPGPNGNSTGGRQSSGKAKPIGRMPILSGNPVNGPAPAPGGEKPSSPTNSRRRPVRRSVMGGR